MSQEIIDLIAANKDLPIYTLVSFEVVGGDYGDWFGKVTSAEIREYANVEPYGYNDTTVVFKDDDEEYYEYLLNQEEYENLSVREAKIKVEEIINNLPYKKAIFIHVGLPDNM